MTIDFVEIYGRLYEIIEQPGMVWCDNQLCDGYVSHGDREIVYSSTMEEGAKIGFVARAVSETWQKLNHPAPLRMAVLSD